MSTVLDYIGRLNDYNVFRQTKKPGTTQQLELALVSDTDAGQICTGIHKLMQRFLLILLLKRGSLTYDMNRGTTFMVDAERGYWNTAAAVRLSFTTATDSARRQLKSEQHTTDPSDEIFAAVELNEVLLGDGRVSLTMTLTSEAGSNYTFIAPINLTVR